MNKTIATLETDRSVLARTLNPIKITLTNGEVSLVIKSLQQGVDVHFQAGDDYHTVLLCRAHVFISFHLCKRLANMQLRYQDKYNLSLNAPEIFVLQSALGLMADYADNMTARLMYGKIHQKTI